MTAAIDITKEQRKTLLALLHRFISGIAVWAYGSRVKWTARPNSDLDLVAFTTPAQSPLVSELKEALAESNLPFLVDFHVWDEVPERFHEIIRKEYVVLQEAKHPESGSGRAGEWVTRKLRECCDFNPSSIKPDWPHRSLHYIDISSVGEGYQTEPPKLFLRSEAPSRAQRLVAPGDCLLSTVRPNRRSMLWLGSVADDVVASTGFAVLRAKPGVIFPRFLYHTIFNQAFTDYLVTREKGAAYPAVSTADIGDAEIALPPLPEQKAIAHILGTLDDKIELNRRMNATLEAIARAMFKSWFVDFDPVRAKLDGRQSAGLDAATAALFHEHFEHGEDGMLPVGWRLAAIEELCAINAWTLGKNDDLKVLEYVEISEVNRGNIANIATYTCGDEPSRARRRLRHGDTVLSTVRPDRGSYFLALNPPKNRVASTGFAVLTPTKAPWSFIHASMTQPEVSDYLGQMADGGAYPAVHPEIIGAMKVALPNEPKILEAFHRTCAPLFEQAEANRTQSRTLAAIRDALLPKLLSGEIQVQHEDAVIREAVHG